jgi:hypothetical protein
MQNNKSINLYDDSSSDEFDLSLNYSENEDINNIKNINNDEIDNDDTNNLIISNLNNKQTEQLSKDIQLSILVSALLDIVFENKKGNLNKILSLLQKYDILNNDFIDYNYSESKFKIKHLINSLLYDKNNLKTLTNRFIQNNDKTKNNKNNIIIYNKKNKYKDDKYSNNFIELENIGTGSYGSVYKVYHKYEKNLYAIKKVHITNELIRDNTDIFREIQLFSKLNHKNIVRYYSSWLDDSKSNNSTLYIQMELCESTFRDYLNNIREDESIEKRIFYFNQIVEGIKYLHDNNIIHRDIKPSNILFIDDTVKICDFGLARHVNSTLNIINGSSEVGTSFYRAPEIDTHIYNNKIDVYSLGIILIELLLKHCKTQAEKMMCMKQILENIKENKIESIPYLITNRYYEIIMNMINVNVKERYDIYEINIL